MKILALNYVLAQMECVCVCGCVYKTFLPKAAEYTFFPRAHGKFFRTDHMLGHKRSLSKFKKTKII